MCRAEHAANIKDLMVILDSKPECNFDALVHALMLLLTAPEERKAKLPECAIMAENFVSRLSEKEVTRAKHMIEMLVAYCDCEACSQSLAAGARSRGWLLGLLLTKVIISITH
jgi:hypothetical protein